METIVGNLSPEYPNLLSALTWGQVSVCVLLRSGVQASHSSPTNPSGLLSCQKGSLCYLPYVTPQTWGTQYVVQIAHSSGQISANVFSFFLWVFSLGHWSQYDCLLFLPNFMWTFLTDLVICESCCQFSVRIAPHWDVCLKWLWDRWVPHLSLPSGLTSPYYLLFIHQIMSSYLQLCGQQHDGFPCPSPSPGVCPSSCLLNQWCHPIVSSSVTLFSFCLQSFLTSGSFPLSRLFTIGHQSIGVSASVLPMSIVFRVDFL